MCAAFAGTWKDLTDNVNLMAANLTTQVRGIAKSRDRRCEWRLEEKNSSSRPRAKIAELADTINAMIDTFGCVSRTKYPRWAREVGIEGKLGGQARVPGAAGISGAT